MSVFSQALWGDSDAHSSLKNTDLAHGALMYRSFLSERSTQLKLHSRHWDER